MDAAWNIMQQENPDDYIIGTGIETSVEDFVEQTFDYLNLDSKKYVKSSANLLRPAKNLSLVADYSKAKSHFGFEPKVLVKDLIKIMVDHDLKQNRWCKLEITFVLPTYNRKEYVVRAIYSCLNISKKSQKIKVRVIVIDGYSNDGAWEKLQKEFSKTN